MRNIVVLGPQGSGKGTQAELLSNYLGIPTISPGVLFRSEVERGTGLGREIQKYIEAGDIVPAETVNQVMHERLQEEDTEKGVMIDGFPRTHEQAVALDKILGEIGRAVTEVIYLKVSDEIAIERMEGRKRADDTPEVMRHRLELYHKDTEPLIEYYRERGILKEVNGDAAVSEIEEEIRSILGV